LTLGLFGCGPTQEPTVVDHSSPEQVFAGFRRALVEMDREALISACDPPLRPAWKELIHWTEKKREAGVRRFDETDVLGDMERRFCGEEELIFEQPQSDRVYVYNAAQGGVFILRERDGKWYVAFNGEPHDVEYCMKLATEIIKSQLGERPAEHRNVSEEVGFVK
jgi:hypothetical protein